MIRRISSCHRHKYDFLVSHLTLCLQNIWEKKFTRQIERLLVRIVQRKTALKLYSPMDDKLTSNYLILCFLLHFVIIYLSSVMFVTVFEENNIVEHIRILCNFCRRKEIEFNEQERQNSWKWVKHAK